MGDIVNKNHHYIFGGKDNNRDVSINIGNIGIDKETYKLCKLVLDVSNSLPVKIEINNSTRKNQPLVNNVFDFEDRIYKLKGIIKNNDEFIL